jgi:hypothetical protein
MRSPLACTLAPWIGLAALLASLAGCGPADPLLPDDASAPPAAKADGFCSVWTWWLCPTAADAGAGAPAGTVRRLASWQEHPIDVAVDGEDVYFATHAAPGTIGRVSTSGRGLQTLAADEDSPVALAVDATHVYWLSFGNFEGTSAALRRVERAGGEPETLAAATGHPHTLALDAAHVYWSDDAGLRRLPKSGGAPEVVAAVRSVVAIALDGTHVYLKEGYGRGAISRIPRTGGALERLAEDQGADSLAQDGEALYWTSAGQVLRLAKAGGGPVALAATRAEAPWNGAVAVDKRHVYWLDTDGVNRVPLAGGEPERLADGQDAPRALALGDGAAFWVNDGSYFGGFAPGPGDYRRDGTVMRWSE